MIAIISGILSVLLIIGGWYILEKAGEKGWKSLIPIYGTYMRYKISDTVTEFVLELVMAPAMALLSFALIRDFSSSSMILMIILDAISGICLLYCNIKFCGNMAKSFGKSTGFAFGLFLLPWLFELLLAFGDARYVGPGGKPMIPGPDPMPKQPDPPKTPVSPDPPKTPTPPYPPKTPIDLPHLVCESGELRGRTTTLGTRCVIGRDSDADVRLANSNISRKHCMVFQQNGSFYLMDTNSTNHTYLERLGKLTPNVPVPIHSGDRFRLGKGGPIFRFVNERESMATTPMYKGWGETEDTLPMPF